MSKGNLFNLKGAETINWNVTIIMRQSCINNYYFY